MIIDDVRVSDEVAAIALEQLGCGIGVVRLRELEQHVLFWRDQHPEMAVFAALRGLHEDASGIGTQIRRLERISLHRLNQGRRELGEHDVPLRQRGAGELEPVPSEDPFLSMQRLMIAPAFNDGLGEQSGPGDALWNWQREWVSDAHRRLERLLVSFAYELLAHDLDEYARSRSSLQHTSRLLPDNVERIEALTLDLGRDELDVNARPVIAGA